MDKIRYLLISLLIIFPLLEAVLLETHPAKALIVADYFFVGLIVYLVYKINYE